MEITEGGQGVVGCPDKKTESVLWQFPEVCLVDCPSHNTLPCCPTPMLPLCHCLHPVLFLLHPRNFKDNKDLPLLLAGSGAQTVWITPSEARPPCLDSAHNFLALRCAHCLFHFFLSPPFPSCHWKHLWNYGNNNNELYLYSTFQNTVTKCFTEQDKIIYTVKIKTTKRRIKTWNIRSDKNGVCNKKNAASRLYVY